MRGRRARAVGILLLVCLLVGLLLWSGTITPNPEQHRYPGNDDLIEDYNAYVGSQAQVSGTVVQTNPLTIEITSAGEHREIVVRNSEQSVTPGERLTVFGTVQPDDTIVRQASMTRESWEAQYMYLVSFLAGLWVLARLLNGWQLNTTQWTIEPRDTPRITLRGGSDA